MLTARHYTGCNPSLLRRPSSQSLHSHLAGTPDSEGAHSFLQERLDPAKVPRARTGLWGASPAQACSRSAEPHVVPGGGRGLPDPPHSFVHPWMAASSLEKAAEEHSCICPNRQVWQLSAQRDFWFLDNIPNMNSSHPSQGRFARQETAQSGGEHLSAAETTQAGEDHATAEHLVIVKTAETSQLVLILHYRPSFPLWLLNPLLAHFFSPHINSVWFLGMKQGSFTQSTTAQNNYRGESKHWGILFTLLLLSFWLDRLWLFITRRLQKPLWKEREKPRRQGEFSGWSTGYSCFHPPAIIKRHVSVANQSLPWGSVA